ncbi:hypothetical protein L6164_035531 [Bauhinia variegata]|uniref:Uncharacterized protein n=1 Tax=Bauhinia variegata TaxID=167791 RepID=A0ACB9KE81_BAUVA|nr:hypothetical protein L6164_035531 [Bauhinia variegata]
MEQEIDQLISNMGSLGTKNNRRGLSRCYSGKARSFTCVADARCVEDLKKPKHPDAKKRKKHSDRKEFYGIPPYPCRRVSSTTHCASPCVGA